MEVISKICNKCGIVYPATIEYFYKHKGCVDGLVSTCKKCHIEQTKKYREDNIEIVKARQKKYRDNNKEKIIKLQKKNYDKNKKKILAKNKEWFNNNKNKQRIYRKSYEEKSAKYNTYNSRLKPYESIKNNNGYLEVTCDYCGKWFSPTNRQVKCRMGCINGNNAGESRFYCQDFCKKACPIYYQISTPKQNQYTKSNEVNPQLRQRVFDLDNYECQMCGSNDELHCHHILPAALNPMTANDPDVCITLCKKCHASVHSKEGCRYHELKCKT